MAKRIAAFFIMFAVTLGAAVYAARFGKSEMVHFSIAAPVGYIGKPAMIPGEMRPIRLAPIAIDLDRRGFLKRWMQPNIEGISTHWIYNSGKKPVRIRMEMKEGSVPIAWEVKANFPYDPATRTFTRPLEPGKSIPNLAIDWFFDLPCAQCPLEARKAQKKCDELLYDGGLRLVDADTGETLTYLPIRIGRGAAVAAAASRRRPV